MRTCLSLTAPAPSEATGRLLRGHCLVQGQATKKHTRKPQGMVETPGSGSAARCVNIYLSEGQRCRSSHEGWTHVECDTSFGARNMTNDAKRSWTADKVL